MEEKAKTETKKTKSVSNVVEAQTHTVDATGKKLGRLASEVAHLLMEKNMPQFEKHRKLGNKVIVTNASKLFISEKRGGEIRYKRASGYPGNLVEETINQVKDRRGIEEVIRRAVKGMIPANKLRSDMLKRLEVVE